MPDGTAPRFAAGDFCIFTNKGNGFNYKNGKKCRIALIKDREAWFDKNMPEYCVEFFDGDSAHYRVWEKELEVAP